MKHILITTDFSSHSRYTIWYLLNLMQETQIPCRILLLNTYLVNETDVHQIIPNNDEMKKKSKEGLEVEQREAQKIIQSFKENSKENSKERIKITIETASHLGSLKNVVWQLLQKEKFDLVAMGKDGGKHVEGLASLLKEAECPLLITYQKRNFPYF